MNFAKSSYISIDWGLLLPVLILAVFGLVTLSTINISFFRSQLVFMILGLLAYFFFANVHFRILQFYSFPIYIVSFVLLLFVLLLGIESRGAVRWIDIFGLRIQFSEILKPFLLISLSSFLGNNHQRNGKNLIFSLFSIFLITFLIFLQPDLGNALIYLGVSVIILLTVGFPLIWFAGGFGALLVLLPVFWNLLHDYQKQRVLTFFSPTEDPLGSSYNAAQSIIAVGSGMFFGKGLGQGTQSMLRFLPERHTDFIFAALTEEFGLVGGIFLLALFALLLFKIFTLFTNASDITAKIFAASAFSLLLVEVFVNIGMNMGILPIVGVTLPFISYGGSAILSNFILLGFLTSAGKEMKERSVLEIR